MFKRLLIAVCTCIIAVPALIFAGGSLALGPYEGERGLLGFAGGIYSDALTGHLAAWILLFAPLLLVGIWMAVARLHRIMPK